MLNLNNDDSRIVVIGNAVDRDDQWTILITRLLISPLVTIIEPIIICDSTEKIQD